MQTRFTAMRDATQADYQVIGRHSPRVLHGPARPHPDATSRLLAGDTGGYAVDRLTHSLQTATRAQRDGRDDEYVVCALATRHRRHARLAPTTRSSPRPSSSPS